jgi:hypothetical protein
MGSQAKAPVPLDRKPLGVTVGQTLSSANAEFMPIFSRHIAVAVRERTDAAF